MSVDFSLKNVILRKIELEMKILSYLYKGITFNPKPVKDLIILKSMICYEVNGYAIKKMRTFKTSTTPHVLVKSFRPALTIYFNFNFNFFFITYSYKLLETLQKNCFTSLNADRQTTLML